MLLQVKGDVHGISVQVSSVSSNFSMLILVMLVCACVCVWGFGGWEAWGVGIHFIYRSNVDFISTSQSHEFLYRCLIGKDLIHGGINFFSKYGLLGCF